MPIGASDGSVYKNNLDYQTASRMPPGSPTEAAGALKSSEGSQTPPNTPENKILYHTASPLVNFTEGDIDKAVNMGLAFSGGGLTFAGEKGLANLGSVAKHEAMTYLSHAKSMESVGEHPDDILYKTEFFRGADGKWRREIDDSQSSFDKNWSKNSPHYGEFGVPLPKVLDHPELYETYPDLKNVKVRYDPNMNGAVWDNKNNQIVMGPNAAKSHGVLMHEIQHAIQDYEGFAKGAFPYQIGEHGPSYLRYNPTHEMFNEYKELQKNYVNLDPEEKIRANHLHKIFTTYHDYLNAANQKAHENYYRSAGETESRNVETRLLLNQGDRSIFPPQSTEDISRQYQIPTQSVGMGTAYGLHETGKPISK